MAVLGLVLVVGLALTMRWTGTQYEAGALGDGPLTAGRTAAPVRAVVSYYLRGVAIALVGGFWAGLLVTGPAIRLVMRLLAVTAGDDAQGRLTEAREVVGDVDLGGTVALMVFGGLFAGLLSGVVYAVIRRWLPSGRWAGITFGGLHLVIAATRLDPLRPDNPDFGLVGPGWLAVVTFGLAAMLHGMAVVAFSNRYSVAFSADLGAGVARPRVLLPLVLPGVIALASVVVAAAILTGLVVVVAASRISVIVGVARSRGLVVGGRVLLVAATAVMLPGAIADLQDIAIRG